MSIARLLLLSILLLCTVPAAQAYHVDETTIDITDEGYVLIFTPDRHVFTELCGPDKDDIKHPGERKVGCAKWQDTPPVVPATACLMVVYTGKDMKRTPQSVLEHEYRHCLEGAWHDSEGKEIPKR